MARRGPSTFDDDHRDDEPVAPDLCPLCGRPLIDGPSVSRHHLIPRKFKGREAVAMHTVCHDKIHAVLGERELARDYDTVEKLLEHPDIAEFIKWVARKPADFVDGHADRSQGKRR
jgi:5-methylcytosine-specific restriction endonuclease McrA